MQRRQKSRGRKRKLTNGKWQTATPLIKATQPERFPNIKRKTKYIIIKSVSVLSLPINLSDFRESEMALWWFHLLPLLLSSLLPPSSSAAACDFFQGSWVVDEFYPLYNGSSCPFIGFNCLSNGRPDKEYLKYRWKPTACDLPRFNGQDFLERNRGKKIMFVGDSLSNNMWQSLTCMLHVAVPNSKYTLTQAGSLNTFYLEEYGVSIMFLKNGFLVDLAYEKIGKVLKLDSISTGDQWKGVDILIFNSFHWWAHTGSAQTWDYFQVGEKVVKEMDHMEAYKIALTTWGKWVDSNIDFSITKVFFQGVAAVHTDGKEWKDPKAESCLRQAQPIVGPTYPGPSHPGEAIVKSVLSGMEKPVYLLDITLLTQLRKDGHPSIYAGEGPKYNDCSHWCLPGAPDSWNELLYAALL